MVLNVVLCLCITYGCSVTSWYRTPERNALVGGVENSQHLTGRAMDLVFDDVEDVDKFCSVVAAYGIECVVEHDHIHIQMVERL